MTSRRRFLSVAAACTALLPFSRAHPKSAAQETVAWKGNVLGAAASLTLVHPDRAHARAQLDVCLAEIERLESILSLYRGDSALVRLNADGELRDAPQELVELLAFALSLADASRGAFDPTVQPLYRLYAERLAQRPDARPSAAEIARVLRLVDYRAVELRADRIRLRRPGMAITLNGVAQGYVTDRIAEQLRAAGFDRVLVDLGEARALGRRADGAPWRAELRDPRDPARTLLSLDLGESAAAALATSAGSGTVFGSDPRTHHLLDPHTGAAANHYLSVSVSATRALIADGLSTALYIVAPRELDRLIARYPEARAYVLDAAGRFDVHPAA